MPDARFLPSKFNNTMAEYEMSDKENTAVELTDDEISEAAGGNAWRMIGTWAGALSKGGGGGGGGGGGMLAQASFQPFKTEPGEEMPSDMTQQTPRK